MIYGMQEAAGRERCLPGQICNVRQPYRGPPVTFPVDLQGSQLSRSVLMGVSVNSVVPTCSPYTSAERWHSSQASGICVNYSPGQAWKNFIYRAIFFFQHIQSCHLGTSNGVLFLLSRFFYNYF